MQAGKGVVLVLALVAGSLLLPAAARAATLTVTTTDDVSLTECTLRDAITAANANSNTGACVGSGGYGTDTIDITATGTINLAGALPALNSSIVIDGPGTSQLDVHRLGGGDYGIFNVPISTVVSISDLTVSNGRTSELGGGIASLGTLTLDRVKVTDNNVVRSAASGAGGSIGGTGGGIYNLGTLTLRRSTVSGNSVNVTNTGPGATTARAEGGAIYNGGTLVIERSTVSGNAGVATNTSADAGAQAAVLGGGISLNNSPASVRLSTVSGNTATGDVPSGNRFEVGGIFGFDTGAVLTATSDAIAFNTGEDAANLFAGGAETLRNTIVSDPQEGPNCSGPIETDSGFNLESPAGCTGLAGAIHSDPLLAPLADNGGPTLTHALGAASPALDAGTSAGDATDQRDLTRPVNLAPSNADDGADIGAFEAQDTDTDGVHDEADNCPAVANSGQANNDADAQGDACDPNDDNDALDDTADQCDLLAGATPSGCPEVSRSLTLGYGKRARVFKGTLSSAPDTQPCEENRDVTVFKRRDGPDRVIGTDQTDALGKYSVQARRRPGRYYATTPAEVIGDVAECAAATSPRLRLR